MVRELRGFLGLTGYYRKFIRHYGLISWPLAALLKKEGFFWNSQPEAASVLALLKFNKQFVMEMNGCEKGIGAGLTQEGRPIAYVNQALGPKHQGWSLYNKELLVVLRLWINEDTI